MIITPHQPKAFPDFITDYTDIDAIAVPVVIRYMPEPASLMSLALLLPALRRRTGRGIMP